MVVAVALGLAQARPEKTPRPSATSRSRCSLKAPIRRSGRTFSKEVVGDKDIGMAPAVLFQMSEGLEDEVRDLCEHLEQYPLSESAVGFYPSPHLSNVF
jgi:hypothetical protein